MLSSSKQKAIMSQSELSIEFLLCSRNRISSFETTYTKLLALILDQRQMQVKFSAFKDVKKGFVRMLETYHSIRKQILKLTSTKLKYMSQIEPLIKNVLAAHRNPQRQLKHFTELSLFGDVQRILKSYNLGKGSSAQGGGKKVRKYEVYSHCICFVNILMSKVSEILPASMDLSEMTSEVIQWKLFNSELNEIKQGIEGWSKNSEQSTQAPCSMQSTNNSSHYQASRIITKVQTPSKNYVSFQNTARVQPHEVPEENSSKSKVVHSNYLKRCKTAKVIYPRVAVKREYPVNVKCPSVKETVTPKPTDSQFGSNLPIKRRTHKKKLYYKENNIQNDEQEILCDASRSSKQKATILILDESAERDQEVQTTQKTQVPYKMSPRKSSSNVRRSSLRKTNKKSPNFLKSSFAQEKPLVDKKVTIGGEEQKEGEQLQSLRNSGMISSKRAKYGKSMTSINSNDNGPTALQEYHSTKSIKEKKSQYFNESKQFQIKKQTNALSDFDIRASSGEQEDLLKKKSNRRMGIISAIDLSRGLENSKNRLSEEEKEKGELLKRQNIQYNQDLLNQQEFDKQKEAELEDIVEEEEQVADYENKRWKFNDFYRFLSGMRAEQKQKAKASPLSSQSVFFNQQEKLREEKANKIQEHIRKLKKKQETTVGEMFDLKQSEENLKEMYFMAIERRHAFECDAEWIKNNYHSNICRRSTQGSTRNSTASEKSNAEQFAFELVQKENYGCRRGLLSNGGSGLGRQSCADEEYL